MWGDAWPATISFGLGISLTLSLGFSLGLKLNFNHFGLDSSLSLTWALGLGLDLSAIVGLGFCLLLRRHPALEPHDEPTPETPPGQRGEAAPPDPGARSPPAETVGLPAGPQASRVTRPPSKYTAPNPWRLALPRTPPAIHTGHDPQDRPPQRLDHRGSGRWEEACRYFRNRSSRNPQLRPQ